MWEMTQLSCVDPNFIFFIFGLLSGGAISAGIAYYKKPQVMIMADKEDKKEEKKADPKQELLSELQSLGGFGNREKQFLAKIIERL
jgi:hypothetical protein